MAFRTANTLNTGSVVTGANAQLIGYNSQRKSLMITCTTTISYIAQGVAANTSFAISPGTTVVLNNYIGAVNCFGTGGTLSYAEETS